MIELMTNQEHRSDMKKRLARIEGQLRGLQKLMDETTECEKILQQMTAARKALDKAYFEMMACVIEHNVVQSIGQQRSEQSEEDVQARMSEVRVLMAKYS